MASASAKQVSPSPSYKRAIVAQGSHVGYASVCPAFRQLLEPPSTLRLVVLSASELTGDRLHLRSVGVCFGQKCHSHGLELTHAHATTNKHKSTSRRCGYLCVAVCVEPTQFNYLSLANLWQFRDFINW